MGFGKDGKGVIIREQRSQALASLVIDDASGIGTKLAITDDFRMLKTRVQASVTGLTAGEGVGLQLGIADGDLSNEEIDAVLAAEGPVDANDILGNQTSMRPVWIIGSINPAVADTAATFVGDDGSPMIEFKPRWTFGSTTSWNWFVYNRGSGTLTTGATIKINAKSFGVWIR